MNDKRYHVLEKLKKYCAWAFGSNGLPNLRLVVYGSPGCDCGLLFELDPSEKGRTRYHMDMLRPGMENGDLLGKHYKDLWWLYSH